MGDGCEGCGSPEARVHLDDVQLCDRCADRAVARLTGMPELGEPPPPFVIGGPDGRDHQLRVRPWRAPTGIVVELEETGVPPGDGFQFSVLGAHDADVEELVARARAQAETEIAKQYLEPNPHRPGWLLRDDEVAGRLVASETSGTGGPYDVVVDGRTLSWGEFGRALEPFEGWRFRLVIEDRHEDVRPDAEVIPLSLPPFSISPTQEQPALSRAPGGPTIDQVLADFLAEQERRLAPRTFRNYVAVIDLLRRCLNGYGHQYLDDEEGERFERAYDGGEEDAFVRLFGPDKLVACLGEFLGYFMVRKVAAGEELLRTAGTVTKKLAKWMGAKGYLNASEAAVAAERGAEAARDLPRAERLSRLLWEQAERSSIDPGDPDDDEIIEGYLMIERVEPGALWFEGGIGPVPVPKSASQIARRGWSVNIVLARSGGRWQVLEVGNVYP